MAVHGGQMIRCRIALVRLEAVPGELFRHPHHQPIARDLRENPAAHDRDRAPIALDDRQLRGQCLRQQESIDQQVVDLPAKLLERDPHGPAVRPGNAHTIDLVNLDDADAPGLGALEDAAVVVVALVRGQQFGVVDPLAVKIRPHDRRPGHHRAGPGPATGFIDAGDRRVAKAERLPLKDPEVAVSFRRFRALLRLLLGRRGRY